MRRKRQSNPRETCPACGNVLENRAAAASHFKSHARRGELEQRGRGSGEGATEWRLVTDNTLERLWWRKGIMPWSDRGKFFHNLRQRQRE